ncbi:Acyl-CoA N-acyltransferase [Cordyceps fumosorosea ARSEF 2679]|uniref:Acyl-CoA N-acyltransferase n=1 Tax=Cordyceps fumosorosea (strain ARSEF 2679) TaxID=1081104 RepID=A0A167SY04_CORFA|nr:Acyl-CoA N-acyltransferase [Cordyceps fumosorosea ARSEF 2679]OAA60050.1 Acyl-CoA N-acyltransferase [Cordyceps fumosorosea ARSEF 2679]
MANITYRDATEADLASIRTIEEYYALNTHSSLLTGVPTLSDMSARFRHLLATTMPYRVAVDVALVDPGVIGYAYLLPSNDAYRPTAELRLWVHPARCGQGVGTQLVDHLLRMMRNWKVVPQFPGELPTATSSVLVRNVIAVQVMDPFGREGGEAARRFFRNRGFRERGWLREVAFKRGQWLDVIYWQFSTLGHAGGGW